MRDNDFPGILDIETSMFPLVIFEATQSGAIVMAINMNSPGVHLARSLERSSSPRGQRSHLNIINIYLYSFTPASENDGR